MIETLKEQVRRKTSLNSIELTSLHLHLTWIFFTVNRGRKVALSLSVSLEDMQRRVEH